MCFLKDSWLENLPRTSHKAVIYRMLKKASVEHVANMLLGGDVCGLETDGNGLRALFKFKTLATQDSSQSFNFDTVARDSSSFIWCKVLVLPTLLKVYDTAISVQAK